MQQKSLTRQLLAEFLGTFTLMIFGLAVNAQVSLSQQKSGEFLSINLGWGIAVTLGIFVAGGVSGAHLNPAVTLAVAVWRRFPARFVLPFIVVQVAGALLASLLVYVNYYDALRAYESTVVAQTGQTLAEGEHLLETASIWATYPGKHLEPVRGGLVDQILGTALLLMCIFAIGDHRNAAPQHGLAAFAVGMVVLMIGMSFGFNCGYAINPARDFGPRLFTYLAGWGPEVFRVNQGFWWVPIVGPLVGGVIGAGLYDLLVLRWHPPESSTMYDRT